MPQYVVGVNTLDAKMAPLVTLVCVTLLARLIATFWLRSNRSWRWALRWGVAAFFMMTASAHFFWFREDLVRMVPPIFGAPSFWVTFTGVAEIAGAIGLLLPATRRFAALALLLLLVAVFPANVYAAVYDIPFGGDPATPLLPRLLEQIFYLCCVAWAGLSDQESRTRHSAFEDRQR